MRLIAYVGTLALVVMAAVMAVDGLQIETASEPVAKTGWSQASRAPAAFAVSPFDSSVKTAGYEIWRHPDGGRRDVLRWYGAGGQLVAELELHRPGAEARPNAVPVAELAGRMDPRGTREVVGEGMVDSKFGAVSLFGFADQLRDGQRCLGYVKTLEAAHVRMSGWSCQGDGLSARRAAIACTLNRLVLLTSNNDLRLQELFAQAELRRAGCANGQALTATSADWVTGAQSPVLRGSL